MFEETLGAWSSYEADGVVYRVGIVSASGVLKKTHAGAFDVVLIGAGGTGSGMVDGGGGGAGYLLRRRSALAIGDYPVTIGAAPATSANTGGSSFAFDLTAEGGGSGGSGASGGTGGNGGGAGGVGGGGAPVPAGLGDPGFAGGDGSRGGRGTRAGGGGGGNGGKGGDADSGVPGRAGPGITIDITGTARIVAPGGTGHVENKDPPPRPAGFDTWGAGGGANGVYPAQSGALIVRYVVKQRVTVASDLSGVRVALGGTVRRRVAAGVEAQPLRVAATARAVRSLRAGAEAGVLSILGTSRAIRSARTLAALAPLRAMIAPFVPRGRVELLDGGTFTLMSGATSPSILKRMEVPEGARVVFSMACAVTGRSVILRRSCKIEDDGAVYYWQDGDTDAPGLYRGEFRLTLHDSAVETLPRDGECHINIRRSIS